MKKFSLKIGYFIIIFLVLCISIGYSALNERLLIDNITAEVRVEKDIRITNVGINSSENEAISKYENYNINNITSSVSLPTVNSNITYRIDITNLGNTEMAIKTITGLPENLTYELLNYNLKDKICANNKCNLGIKKEILLKIKYKNFNPSQTNYTFKLDFEFSQIYSIKYLNLENNNLYPKEILDKETLKINFQNSLPNSLSIKMNNLSLQENIDYTFTNNCLTIPNINGNIEIILNYQSFLKEINKGEYFKEELYFDKIKNVYFVDYIEKDNFLKSYDVTEEQNGRIIAWIVANESDFDLYIGSNEEIKAKSLKGLFQDMLIENIDFNNFSTEETINFQDMFNNCQNLKKLNLNNFTTEKAKNLERMFANCENLLSLNFSNSIFNQDNNLNEMFYNCTTLKDLKLGTISPNVILCSNIFKNVNISAEITVKNEETKNWILNLPVNDRPEVWSDVNISIV